jgi:hypothetical protein
MVPVEEMRIMLRSNNFCPYTSYFEDDGSDVIKVFKLCFVTKLATKNVLAVQTNHTVQNSF